MKYFPLAILIAFAFLAPSIARADSIDLTPLTAQGIAIYGWHNGVPTALYSQNETTPFAIASITKLVTAKAAELLYPQNTNFLVPQSMAETLANATGAAPMVVSRDDLLRAMLISSNNDAAKEFAASVGDQAFLSAMNVFLHGNKYTQENFINPTGLDPDRKMVIPNRLSPYSLSYLMSDIYRNDPLLSSILEQKTAGLVDVNTGLVLQIKSTDELNTDPLYSPYIIMSKTGTTNLAGQSLAFVTGGEGKYDYITVVLLHSKDRYADGKLILDWLQQVLHYTVALK